MPVTASFIAVQPQDGNILCSAFKQAEDGDGFILRLWNASDKAIDTKIDTILPIKSVEQVRMDETEAKAVAFKNGSFSFKFGPHKIETFRLK